MSPDSWSSGLGRGRDDTGLGMCVVLTSLNGVVQACFSLKWQDLALCISLCCKLLTRREQATLAA